MKSVFKDIYKRRGFKEGDQEPEYYMIKTDDIHLVKAFSACKLKDYTWEKEDGEKFMVFDGNDNMIAMFENRSELFLPYSIRTENKENVVYLCAHYEVITKNEEGKFTSHYRFFNTYNYYDTLEENKIKKERETLFKEFYNIIETSKMIPFFNKDKFTQ